MEAKKDPKPPLTAEVKEEFLKYSAEQGKDYKDTS
jgi:hypothetical protein